MPVDKIDLLLEIGKTADWVSPAWSFIQDYLNRPYCRIYLDRYAGGSIKDAARILRGCGIKCWGLSIYGTTMVVTVRQAQRRWADQVLKQNGFVVFDS